MQQTDSARGGEPAAAVREQLLARLADLLRLPYSANLLEAVGLGYLNRTGGSAARLTDLARAVHVLEFASDPPRSALVIEPFLTRGEASRNPGFDGVEAEIDLEDRWLRGLVRSAVR